MSYNQRVANFQYIILRFCKTFYTWDEEYNMQIILWTTEQMKRRDFTKGGNITIMVNG